MTATSPIAASPAHTALPVGEASTMPDDLRRRRPANESAPVMLVNAARFVTVELAGTITGLGAGAVRKRIERGIWLEKAHWRRAADGRIWIDMKGVEKWVEGTE